MTFLLVLYCLLGWFSLQRRIYYVFFFLFDSYFLLFLAVYDGWEKGHIFQNKLAWVCSLFFMYVVCLVSSSWGGWCLVVCSFSMVILFMSGSYFYYYLLSEWLGLDQMALILVFLCFLVLMLSLVSGNASLKSEKKNKFFSESSHEMVNLVILIMSGSIMFFSFSCWMDFYFFFEFSLVPTFWLILKWGYQPERLQAGLYMLMYTVSASLPLLIGLVVLWLEMNSDNMLLAKCLGLSLMLKNLKWAWLFICLSFLVKLPIYFFHGWLPKAHVEAPLSGSMILAGILLKFGSYGIIRFLWMVDMGSMSVVMFILCFSLWGGVISSCVCVVQSDLKSLIAYSSIGHMAVALGGVLSMYILGKFSGVCLFFAHGISSPLLFSLAASAYSVSGTRNVMLSKGLLRSFPLFSLLWFMACIINMSFPPTLNWLGEIYCVCSVVWMNFVFMIPSGMMMFLAGCYSLVLYNWVNHGVSSLVAQPSWNPNYRYIYSGLFMVFILFLMFTMVDFVFV